jgi:hypothetical protein
MTAEVILLATLLVIGIIVGAKSFRDSAVTEWGDFAQALADLDQSYNMPDIYDSSGSLMLAGGYFLDLRDFCDTDADDNGPTTGSNSELYNTLGGPTYYGVPGPGE